MLSSRKTEGLLNQEAFSFGSGFVDAILSSTLCLALLLRPTLSLSFGDSGPRLGTQSSPFWLINRYGTDASGHSVSLLPEECLHLVEPRKLVVDRSNDFINLQIYFLLLPILLGRTSSRAEAECFFRAGSLLVAQVKSESALNECIGDLSLESRNSVE